ncbi:hypothetical protein VTN00DRAFT_2170 [Thermoascus crustaceus]|uniref:uncharacterized protein n=1 Tax=Thermoascus crustaceus TaxID=5088 RepID=UPI0037448C30
MTMIHQEMTHVGRFPAMIDRNKRSKKEQGQRLRGRKEKDAKGEYLQQGNLCVYNIRYPEGHIHDLVTNGI